MARPSETWKEWVAIAVTFALVLVFLAIVIGLAVILCRGEPSPRGVTPSGSSAHPPDFAREDRSMTRLLFAVAAVAAAPLLAHAHMVYVVPAKDGQSITVVFSDSLDPDERVKMDKVAGLKLVARIDGKDAAVECNRDDHSFTAKLTKTPATVQGTAVYGLLTRSEKPTLLVYHPKAVFAGTDAKAATVGEAAALEIVPVTESGKTRFRLLAKGKPVAESEGTVLLPDGKKEKVKTDADGYTPAFEQTGRYAAYLKLNEVKAGEHDGKKYEEVRHYATLVVDVAK